MSLLQPTTFLDCVQRLAFECGIAGTGPTTVLNPTGQTADLVNWVGAAWLEIQNLHTDWSFMLQSPGVSFTTIAGQALYTPTACGIAAGEVSEWKRDTFRNYLTSAGTPSEVQMDYVPYDEWRDLYQIGALRTSQIRPLVFTVHPDQSIGLATPLTGYTITGDYYSTPVAFAADDDEPSLPTKFIMAIVYKAMMFYGAYESAPETYNQGEAQYNKFITRMEVGRLPEIRSCGALC